MCAPLACQREPQRKSPPRSSVSTVAASNGDGIVSRRRVRQVVLHHDDAAVGKLRAQFQVKVRIRNGAHDGYGVDLLGLGVGEMQARGDGVLRHFVEAAPVGAAADELRFFDGGDELAVLEYRGGRIAQQAADSEDDHLGCLPRFSILAQVSLQGYGAVEDRLAGRRIGIDAEVAEALELVARAGCGIGERGFQFAVRQHFERVRIEVGGEILAFVDLVGIFVQ